jgi:hypothetical protein
VKNYPQKKLSAKNYPQKTTRNPQKTTRNPHFLPNHSHEHLPNFSGQLVFYSLDLVITFLSSDL